MQKLPNPIQHKKDSCGENWKIEQSGAKEEQILLVSVRSIALYENFISTNHILPLYFTETICGSIAIASYKIKLLGNFVYFQSILSQTAGCTVYVYSV